MGARLWASVATTAAGLALLGLVAAAIWREGLSDAFDRVREGNEEAIDDALGGIRSGAECRARGGVWWPQAGGGGKCRPVPSLPQGTRGGAGGAWGEP